MQFEGLSAMSDISVYEPLWRPNQEVVEPTFLPYRVTGGKHSAWREFWILCDMYEQGVHRRHRFTGLMSPRFGEKTGLSGREVLEFVAAHGSSDVCLFNPVPQMPYIHFNVWGHGEHNHPGIVERARRLILNARASLKVDLDERHDPLISCYSNYWVGSADFWEAYVGGILVPIATFLEENPDHPASVAVLEDAEYSVPAAYLPFIVERLLTTFLAQHHEISSAAWFRDPVAASHHDTEREIVLALRDKVDAADAASIFSIELRSQMNLLGRLLTLYEIQFYARNPRPFDGRVLPFKRTT